MTITDEQDARLTLVLQGLKHELNNLYPSARSFVEDQIKRHQEYGSGIFVSPKQWKWLEDLYKQFVGDEEDEPPGLDDDLKDEIPF